MLGCSDQQSDTEAKTGEPAQEAAIQEVETQPATEVDSVHISPELLKTYQRTCGSCHQMGVAGAPKTGDAEAWKPRLAKGMDVMVANVREGLNVMPPTGLCSNCTDEDYAALIAYMATAQ